MTRRIAVILYNLGGPNGQDAVRPFLFNLFNDKWIIAAPAPIRWSIARLISTTRAKSARANYAKMGGGSPIVPETQAQADALDKALAGAISGAELKCFLAMRYWEPFGKDAAAAAKAWGATEALLLPLYPQFSSTTTRSAMEAWAKATSLPTKTLCCYPAGDPFARAHAEAIMQAWDKGGRPEKPRVLFSAHGLPQRTIDKGDSYQWQVERTVAAVRPLLPPEWDHRICYQSRVGPLKWIGPSTEEEIDRAAADQAGLIVSPIAFVSEHIETLVELDEEYAERAHEKGVRFYLRAPALGASPLFIQALRDLTLAAVNRPTAIASETGQRLCPGAFGLCPMKPA
jgi:protoporphyrin/coproporphyrin ferrochelatase